MFIVTLSYLRPLEELDALMPEHVAWLKKHYKSGLFIASGRQVPRKGGVILARSGDRKALETLLKQDPFIESDCASAEIVEFTPSMTAHGAEVLKAL
ncbi:YciI family protein [Variovorax sp. J22P168]|uniref:YciI family protein n=1 Tax=Variovorax jilinensis TaxID=3053513 RepID=UPI002576458D|nr:YciI family protein [Variovorax sp. J22P168]MDM0014957.1 YciI family protein [Variovorax sp. J22P168]